MGDIDSKPHPSVLTLVIQTWDNANRRSSVLDEYYSLLTINMAISPAILGPHRLSDTRMNW
jgi:hypothetical protein